MVDPSGIRGVPDVSMNAALTSGVLIWESFNPYYGPGWFSANGTSEATPMWAATDAVMNQADGPLGFLAPRLYQILEDPTLYAEASTTSPRETIPTPALRVITLPRVGTRRPGSARPTPPVWRRPSQRPAPEPTGTRPTGRCLGPPSSL